MSVEFEQNYNMRVRSLCPALAEIARVELNEDTKSLEESIRCLKQWIQKQPHLRARTDDQWLAAFLRGTKFRLEQTKSKMDLYYSLRSTAPYLYNIKYYDPKVIEIINIGCTLILQKTKNPADPRVIIYRLGLCDPKKFSLIDILSVFGFQEQICFMEDDNFVVSGAVNVVDLTGSTLAHYTSTSIKQIRNIIRANQEAVPLRIKSMHFINTSPFLETFLNISKRFMSEKSKNRIMIHNKNIESLHEYVPIEVLPEEYGGTGDSIQSCIDHWKKKMSDYSSFFEDDLKFGSDESKRPRKSITQFVVSNGFKIISRRISCVKDIGLNCIKIVVCYKNKLTIPQMIRELSPELAKIAKNELNENPTQVASDLQNLKEWISKQSHLRARTDDQWLIALLRGCKFSLERVKAKLDLFYTLRTTAPEVTLRQKPTEPQFLEFLRLGTCVILPQPKNSLSPCVILIRAGEYDPDKYNVADIMCILYYLVQILVIENDTATVMGTVIAVDYQNVTLNHLTQASPSLLKKLVAVSQDSLPLRLKGSHHVNVPSGIEIIFKLVSGFLGEKARERLKIYKTNEDLLKNLPKEVMPTEYGGTGGPLNDIIEYWAKKIVEYRPWMEKEMEFGTDESKRTNENMSNKGSFRKLDID
ncbi:uncharacterized protein LOC126781107 [Nymphalis io]|uniref:uncharacterized protein LOC126781107 n=1 Tax=Inachis io TaxID=171585 RepID=UPI002169545A|nr:uncharacterized protein LOC126781107 [Nymphalis io]